LGFKEWKDILRRLAAQGRAHRKGRHETPGSLRQKFSCDSGGGLTLAGVAAGVAPSAPAQAEGQKSIDYLEVATDFEDCMIR